MLTDSLSNLIQSLHSLCSCSSYLHNNHNQFNQLNQNHNQVLANLINSIQSLDNKIHDLNNDNHTSTSRMNDIECAGCLCLSSESNRLDEYLSLSPAVIANPSFNSSSADPFFALSSYLNQCNKSIQHQAFQYYKLQSTVNNSKTPDLLKELEEFLAANSNHPLMHILINEMIQNKNKNKNLSAELVINELNKRMIQVKQLMSESDVLLFDSSKQQLAQQQEAKTNSENISVKQLMELQPHDNLLQKLEEKLLSYNRNANN
jgi:hypothetical protein